MRNQNFYARKVIISDPPLLDFFGKRRKPARFRYNKTTVLKTDRLSSITKKVCYQKSLKRTAFKNGLFFVIMKLARTLLKTDPFLPLFFEGRGLHLLSNLQKPSTKGRVRESCYVLAI